MDGSNETTPQGDVERKELQLTPIEETDYLNRELKGQDYRTAKIHAYVANATHPLTILPTITQHAEEMVEAVAGNSLSPAQKKESIESRVTYYMDQFSTTGTMLSIRDEALALEQEFREAKLSPESDRIWEYLRRATDLHSRMEEYFRQYYDFRQGTGRNINIKQDISGIVHQAQSYVENNLKMKRDLAGNTGKSLNCDFNFQIDKDDRNGWDREEVKLHIGEDDKIQSVWFDELFSYTKYCTGIEDVSKVAELGESITDSQKNLIRKSQNETNGEDADDGVDISKVTNFSPLPISVFIQSIPVELREKIKGKSRKSSYAVSHHDVDGILLNERLHDFGELQYSTIIDTQYLSNDEVWELVALYAQVLKEFPRVPKDKLKSA